MRRFVLILLIFCFAVPRRWEAGLGAGPSFFFGDVGGYSRTKNWLGFRDMTYLQTRFDVSGSFKYRVARTVNIRLNMSYAMLNATDVRGSNEGREYQSTTSIFEPSVMGEYYFVKNRAEMSYLFIKGKRRFFTQILRSLDFYAFAGVGGVAYTVKANDALLERIYNPNINFGVELGGRYAFTDYLDGYSNPQFSKANDVYYFLNFTVTYKLKTGPHGWPSFR
jgi:hypothetical protein